VHRWLMRDDSDPAASRDIVDSDGISEIVSEGGVKNTVFTGF
jgi:hypothetical protein